MNSEFSGSISVVMAGAHVRVNYRVVYGSHPHIMSAHINVDTYGSVILVATLPDAVRVRIYDDIMADVRDRQIKQMAERNPLETA